MRDLHSHYLPVDDGARSLEMSKQMLDLAASYHIHDIMFTPHYMPDTKYMSPVSNNRRYYTELKQYAEELGINIYLGNEVYCNPDIISLYKAGEVTTLNQSRYMLIEVPLYDQMSNVKSIFWELLNIGIVPILAHPERYAYYYDDLDFFFALRDMGVLLQINYPSLFGTYGTKAKKMAKKLLKANLISFVGSDIHSPSVERMDMLNKLEKKVIKYVGAEKARLILDENFMKVVKNEDIY